MFDRDGGSVFSGVSENTMRNNVLRVTPGMGKSLGGGGWFVLKARQLFSIQGYKVPFQ